MVCTRGQSGPLVDTGLLGEQPLHTLGALGTLDQRLQQSSARHHIHAEQGRSHDEDQALQQPR